MANQGGSEGKGSEKAENSCDNSSSVRSSVSSPAGEGIDQAVSDRSVCTWSEETEARRRACETANEFSGTVKDSQVSLTKSDSVNFNLRIAGAEVMARHEKMHYIPASSTDVRRSPLLWKQTTDRGPTYRHTIRKGESKEEGNSFEKIVPFLDF